MKRLLSIFISLGSFWILSYSLWKIANSWGTFWAFINFIPLSVAISILSGIILKYVKLEDRIGPIIGLSILTGIFGAMSINPLQEAFLLKVDSSAVSLLHPKSEFTPYPGYINLKSLSLCDNSDLYSQILWDLVKRGMKMKDNDNTYYGYDAAFPLKIQGKETSILLYFETVGYGEVNPPSQPTEKEWIKYCKEKLSWVKILKDSNNRNAKFVRKSFPDELNKLIYVNSTSPTFDRWAWSIGFGILILLNLRQAI